MMRFFVDKKENNYFVLNKEVLHHIKVARVTQSQFICVYQEVFYICILENNLAKIIEKLDKNHEFKKDVILAAALINFKKFEMLIQKACELGAKKLIPILSENVEQKLSSQITKKIERWNQISIAAAEQSFRNKAMEVALPIKFIEVLKLQQNHKFIAHEKTSWSFQKNSFPTDSLFLVGPEGGFTNEEFNLAIEAGFQQISLGKRILRAETAALFLLSRVNE